MNRPFTAMITAAVLAVTLAPPPAAATQKRIPAYKNCAALNKTFRHGIARPGARDKAARGKRAVASFLVSAQGYTANKRLDGSGWTGTGTGLPARRLRRATAPVKFGKTGAALPGHVGVHPARSG
jgi:hypothetical protein